MTITNAYLTHNRPYTKRTKTTAIAVHWVGNPGSTAAANRNYFQTTSTEVSSNYIIGLSGEVICCIPDEEVSWCTNQANSYTVSIETCHPDATGKFNTATYNALVELTAQLCKKYGLDPQKGGVIRHFDVTGKVCPKWFVPRAKGGTDTNSSANWMKFLSDVAAKMGAESTKAETSGKKYRTDWKQGEKVTIADQAQLFVNESTATPSSRLRGGTYYIYDGKICKNGRYRITTTKANCGKTPAGKYVTGYVSIDKMS
ncbi:peptidoglycan recognition family protein [Ruminococcus sp.]|uniref:peptidoglycan recognition protein family protein n=1 Tax=Ruminococcus sp. TaxID=41978 RepID=UPI0025F64B8B|nr:peptidoglycan recognition family protein [Ruminococcus sp.]